MTAQAVSKWENETGMPDISLIVPLAGVFGVSTDVIFGLDTTTAGEDVAKILRDAEADKVRGGAASYIKAYDRISEGLRKYPCDQRLLMNGFTLGMSLCMPDSELYSAAQLGKAYITVGRSSDAVKLFERYFAAMKVIFDGERPRPYHDFDSGDCYLLLAKTYLTLGEKAKAMKCLRDSVEYYVGMFDRAGDAPVDLRSGSPFVSGSQVSLRLDREVVRRRIERKIDSDLIAELHDEPGFDEIRGMVGKL